MDRGDDRIAQRMVAISGVDPKGTDRAFRSLHGTELIPCRRQCVRAPPGGLLLLVRPSRRRPIRCPELIVGGPSVLDKQTGTTIQQHGSAPASASMAAAYRLILSANTHGEKKAILFESAAEEAYISIQRSPTPLDPLLTSSKPVA
jgi:hypothetical protein